MYDYLLGGKDNFAADREAVERLAAAVPYAADVARENRRFLQRATRFAAAQGIAQFIDIGTGLPTVGNVHEIARRVRPGARVVYVDIDPVVLAHARAMLVTDEGTHAIQADIRDPAAILGNRTVLSSLDFSRPICLLMVAVVHFLRDEDDPAGLIRTYVDALPPGSYLVLSHLATDGPNVAHMMAAIEAYATSSTPLTFRSSDAIRGFFHGLHLIEPGLVRAWEWRPVPGENFRTGWIYAGVGRKPDGDAHGRGAAGAGIRRPG